MTTSSSPSPHMKKRCFVLICLLSLTVRTVSAVIFQDINLQSAETDLLKDSQGADLTGSFNYVLGTFGSSFAPSGANSSLWFDNWIVFHEADFNDVPPPPVFAFSDGGMRLDGTSVFTHPSNDGYDFSNQRAWLWIYNSTDITSETTEWFLGSAQNWVFPDKDTFDPEDCCPGDFPINWAVSDFTSADTPVWGSQSGLQGEGYFDFTSSDFTVQTYTVIPEPGAVVLACVALAAAALGCFCRKGGRS